MCVCAHPGFHTLQKMVGCELDEDGTTRGFNQYGFNGEHFVSLDLNTVSWTTDKPQSVITENKWDSTGHRANYCTNFLKHERIERLKTLVFHGKEILERQGKVGDLYTHTHTCIYYIYGYI